MTKEEKNQFIDVLDKSIQENSNFYLADISGLTAEESSALRRLCFKREVSLQVVKNTLLKKAFENTANPELLETLEDVYRQSGAEEQILEIIGGIHKSRKKAVPASLLFAKLLYQNNQLEEAIKVLGQVNIPSVTSKENKTYFENKNVSFL